MSRPIATLFGGFGRIGITDMSSPLATHVHPHLHVILKLGGADTAFQVRRSLCPVTSDTAVLVNSWEPHAWTYAKDAGPTRFLTLYLDSAWLAEAGFPNARSGIEPFFHTPVVQRSVAADQAIKDLSTTIFRSARGTEPLSSQPDTAPALTTLLQELRMAAWRAEKPNWTPPAFDYRIRRAMGMLVHHEEPVSVESVAETVGLSRPRFFELFKQCTGVTPNRVSSAARMERAISLLAKSDMPLGDLAATLNFATPGNFSRFFRSQIGLSPNDFRRSAIPSNPR